LVVLRCAIPELPNDTFNIEDVYHELLLNVSIPWEKNDDGDLVRSECRLYQDRNLSSYADGELLPNRTTVSCGNWVFDKSTFQSTFTELV
jgi:hypothetical protein